MEAFYQESGRAGRDQLPSRSLLYYGLDDRKRMVLLLFNFVHVLFQFVNRLYLLLSQCWQEFIVSNVKSKKSQSVGSEDSLLKKSLADLNQMAEYCEGFDCRRKKLLGSFGEQVSSSFCGKTCDVCKHPNLVAKHLEELALASSNYRKNGLPPIFINSLPNMDAEKTEFWNREDEASISDEDISDSDDGVEVVNSLTRSKLSSKSGLNERLEYLERAEEAYLKKNGPTKQAGSDKKAISETLREAAKQRLSNALKQAQQRLGNSIIELKESASVLENECYKKYGKVGKTFYNSQVASTVRWLSSASISEINDRLHSGSTKTNCAANLNSMPSLLEISDQDPQPTELNNDKNQDRALPEASSRSVQIEIPSQEIALPPILSFSEFVSKKGEEGQLSLSSVRGKHLMKRSNAEPGKHARNDAEKRGRLQ
ncbi:hypothetical protein AAC387_Pa01g1384 [Persea americana]